MRIDVKKFIFVGVAALRDDFFQKAQQVGIIDFISSSSTSLSAMPQNVQDILAAIKVLRGLEPTEQEDVEDFCLASGITKEILELKQLRQKCEENLRVLSQEIARIEPFGDFNLSQLKFIEKEGKCTIQFFCARRGRTEEKNIPSEIIYVNSDNDLDYFISIAKKPVHPPKMIEMHILRSLSELKEEREKIQQELHLTEKRLRTFAKYNKFLHQAVIKNLNTFHLTEAQNHASYAEDKKLFYVEGWVPKDKIKELHALTLGLDIFVEEIAIEPKDVIPTYLENEGPARIGEDLVGIYDTPSHTDKDPSMWVLIWFALFFALIVGDGGYGLVFLASAIYISYKIKKPTKGGKRFLKLFGIVSAFCIVWGVLMNSFFGIEIPFESPLRKVSLLHWLVVKKTAYHMDKKDDVYEEWIKKYPQLKDIQDPEQFVTQAGPIVAGTRSSELLNKFVDNIMLEIALMIGAIHIMLSLARYLNRNWSNLGWILFIIGGYLYFPYFLHATSIIHFVFGVDKETGAQQGLYFIFAGITVALIFNLMKHKLLGVFESMTMIQIFADIMSYLRLYALGLAGGIVAATINQIAEAVPFVIAVVLIAAAHVVNMLMGAVGGVIHGLRLNFLEWYHYSFEGGGKKFAPLKELEIE